MDVIYKPFKSIEQIKERAELIPKGKIIPRRIFSVIPRKHQHKLVSKLDLYCLPTPSGYIVFVDVRDSGDSRLGVLKDLKSANIIGSPYLGNITIVTAAYNVGNISDHLNVLYKFNNAYLEKCGEPASYYKNMTKIGEFNSPVTDSKQWNA